MARWHLAFTSSRAEGIVCNELKELEFQSFSPVEKVRRKVRGRKLEFEVPLFPRYVFVRFDPMSSQWRQILDVSGLVDVVRESASSMPLRMPDVEVERLQLAEKLGIFDRTKPMQAGVEVEIMDGPFAGFVGKVARARSDDRIDVLLQFLGTERLSVVPITALRSA